ncbi:MAG: PAS domain-containing protein [Gaiellaceae bacterium MAG52_C11]|nr:PAS domain-containing protein [Candidatus Gaiellasilicea maunaloa]
MTEEILRRESVYEAIFDTVAEGITAEHADGRLVYANDAAARLVGYESAKEFLAAPPGELSARSELLDEHRRPLPFEELPGQVALRDGRPAERTICYRAVDQGDERWSVVRSTPVTGESGKVELAITAFYDVTEQRRFGERARFLGEVSTLLASPIELELALTRLVDAIVPAVADYCIVDLVVEGGPLRQGALRHVDPAKEALLREVRRLYPPDGNPDHPASQVLARGSPLLIERVDVDVLATTARDDHHLELYRGLEPTSYLVVPLTVRGRTLGTLALGTGESGRRYTPEDVAFAEEAATRIALGVENAQLYTALRSSYALLDTLLLSAPVGIGFWDRDLRFVRVNDALAEINGLAAVEHVGKTLADVKPELAPILEPLYRQVLETGEPIVHNESTDDAGARLGDRRHWLSSYYPVRSDDGEITGVGAVIMDTTRQRRADDRLRLLAEAGELFASSLDAGAVFARIARVVVPRLADSIHIFLAEGASLERVACAHADPELQPFLEALPSSYPLGPDSPGFMATVYERAEPVLLSDVPVELYEPLARLGVERTVLERIGSRSMMLVPLVARSETLGVFAIGSREPGRYLEDDLSLAVELAGRAAVALDNARLFREASFRTSQLEAQQEASLDGLLLVSPEGHMLSYNRRFAELWGLSAELGAAGHDEGTLAQAMQRVADPADLGDRVHYLYAHPQETGREEILLEDGRVFDRYGAAVRSPDGRSDYGWLWSFRDVTEVKRTEAELERRAEASKALEFVGDGVALLDADGVVRLWNPAAAAITGLCEGDVLGRTLVETIPGWADVERLASLAARRRSGVVRAETFPLEFGGRELWLSISGVTFGEGTVYAFRDLTEEHAVDRLKSDFVSTVSHELRTPLAAIYGAAMTLQRGDVSLSADQRDGMLGVVASESERLARIVNDILLASRLDSGLVDVSIARADPVELVRTVLAAARTHLPPEIELSSESPDDVPAIRADADKVRQVLVNLVENAIKYSPDGGRVSVALEPSGGRLRISVVDEGLGIPAAEHERIFEKFYRLDPNLTRGVGGTGLGLYICREIVRRMDGRIWVDSGPGRGSTFSFELPLAG